MQNTRRESDFKKRVVKLKLSLKRANSSLKQEAEKFGCNETDVYNLTGRKDHPDSGKLYELGVKMGLIDGELQ